MFVSNPKKKIAESLLTMQSYCTKALIINSILGCAALPTIFFEVGSIFKTSCLTTTQNILIYIKDSHSLVLVANKH